MKYSTHGVVVCAKVITLAANRSFFKANNVISHLQTLFRGPSPHFSTKDGGRLDDSRFLFGVSLGGDSAA